MPLVNEDSKPLVNTYDQVQDIIPLLQAPGVDQLGIDYETDGLNIKTSKIHGLSIATKTQGWYFTGGAEQALYPVLQELAKNVLFVGHNLAFDLHFMWRHGIYPARIADTMMAQFLIDENQELGLKSLAHTKLHYDDLPDFKSLMKDAKAEKKLKRLDQVKIEDIPINKLAIYAARDAQLTLELLDISKFELAKEGMTDLFWNMEMPFVQVLADMEETGFYIDTALLDQLEAEFTQIRDESLQRFTELSGGLNPNSPMQLSTYFYGTLGLTPTVFTKTGSPSVDALALARLAKVDKTGSAEHLKNYRQFEKLLGTYVYSFREKMIGNQLFGHFNQLGDSVSENGRLPRTGRLSSSDPNLQNIPARGDVGKKVRQLFISPDGHVVVVTDQSQLEMRIGAHYTRDPNLIKVFEEKGDPHQLTSDLCGVVRFIAKGLNFGNFYGQGPRKLADTIEKGGNPRPTDAEAKEYQEKFRAAYPAIENWKRRVVDYARELGYVRTIAGRRRRLPDLRERDRSLRATAERQAVNTIIQGSAADILKMAMLNIYPYHKQYGARLACQVHDELVHYVPENNADEFASIVQREMEGVGEYFKLRVRLEAVPGIGPNWQAAK